MKINNKNNNLLRKNLILGLIVIIMTVIPLLFLKNADFSGSDDKAEEAITEIDSTYKPWFSPIFEPKSSEIESLLFSLQAAIGAGIIGYYFGYIKGKSKDNEGEKK